MRLVGWDECVTIDPLFNLRHLSAKIAISAAIDHLLVLLKGPAEELCLIEQSKPYDFYRCMRFV